MVVEVRARVRVIVEVSMSVSARVWDRVCKY